MHAMVSIVGGLLDYEDYGLWCCDFVVCAGGAGCDALLPRHVHRLSEKSVRRVCLSHAPDGIVACDGAA